ncbi:hypothetical protein vBKpnAMK6_00374 [Klebsiella phage vB_Kpn_AM_K6]
MKRGWRNTIGQILVGLFLILAFVAMFLVQVLLYGLNYQTKPKSKASLRREKLRRTGMNARR